jgi:hypothetical protein
VLAPARGLAVHLYELIEGLYMTPTKIVVTCPSCAARVNAPERMAGRSARCPRCGGRVAVPSGGAPPPAIVPVAAPAPALPRPAAVPVTVAAPALPRPAAVAPGNGLGISALVLGCVAVPLAFIPFVSIIGLALAGVGLLFGLLAVLACAFRRGYGMGFALGGAAASGISFAVALTATWASYQWAVAWEQQAREHVRAAQSPAAPVRQAADQVRPAQALAAWIDAAGGEYTGQGVAVRVTGVEVGRVRMRQFGQEAESKEVRLVVRLEIRNTDDKRKINQRGWSASLSRVDGPTLQDDLGNQYRRFVSFGAEYDGQADGTSVYPGKAITDVAVFEVPVAAASTLMLELPAEAFGGIGVIRFRFAAPKPVGGQAP